jgi:hypothetical protein
MKNVKFKIKNEGEDGKWGNEDRPMMAGGSASYAYGAGWGGDVQSLGAKVDPVRNWEWGVRNFEYLRLKTTFRFEGHPEGWTPNGEGNKESITRTRTKNRNDEGMASGAFCLFVPPDGCGRLDSPGTSAVAGDLAGAVQDASVQNCRFPEPKSPKLA